MNETKIKERIVVSAVNFTEGGPLTILTDCLLHLNEFLVNEYDIYAVVHDRNLFPQIDNVQFISYRKVKSSWFRRLYFEYFFCKKLSAGINPCLWFSLHDMTPNVTAKRRAVYCHNPSPFARKSFKDLKLAPGFFLFTLFYKYLYRINLHHNDFIVVQQEWIRNEFSRLFKVDKKKIIVAKPGEKEFFADKPLMKGGEVVRFIFPTYPRSFKNIEIIGKAVKILNEWGLKNYEVIVTINGTENAYAKAIVNEFGSLKPILFIGGISREAIDELYAKVDCLIFPSKLETWGLPITEFKSFNKTIFLADLPYAKEALGYYEYAKFFDPDNAQELASHMKSLIEGTLINYDVTRALTPGKPYTQDWKELFEVLLQDVNQSSILNK